ncbi:hypothetical protein QF047_004167 [Arthrobacter sp. W4I7]|nr:hypothetical protein [Arthrobacter sp. W4I7]
MADGGEIAVFGVYRDAVRAQEACTLSAESRAGTAS